MLSLLKAYKRLIAFGFTVLAIVQLPKDVQDLPEAARPWWKFWQMVDQNTALWAALLACGIWISWTDLRPLWFKYRGPRFSARHAAILQELADQLAEVKQLATTRLTSLAKVTDTLKIEYYVSFREAGKKAMRMADQIAYDRSTYDTVKDYLHLCDMIADNELNGQENGSERAELEKISGPIFRRLHEGKSINRDAIPLPQWMRELGTKTQR